MITEKNLIGKRLSVIGAGVSGKAIAELAAKLGADVFISDSNPLPKETEADFDEAGIKWESDGNTERLLNADEIIISSGISPDVAILKEAVSRGIPLVGELDFVYPYLSGTIVAVTGSNGKTTTTSMTGYFLGQSGYNTITAGNIGNPVAKAADGDYDFIVLELSSFQLHWAKIFRCDVGIITNLAPDHIDWHGSYEKYVEAKANIVKCLRDDGSLVFQKRDADVFEHDKIKNYPLSWGEPIENISGIYLDRAKEAVIFNDSLTYSKFKMFNFSDVKLLGTHNLENAAMSLAVLALYNIGPVSTEVIRSYEPPKHRCSLAVIVRGITFIDDSKGTNVAASVTAMSSLPGDKVIILGGKGKGENYAPLADAVIKYTRSAVLLGEEKDKIASALNNVGYLSYSVASGMKEAVEAAYAIAVSGDTVLLSPACTSWDMYPNYGARGDHFCKIAREIAERDS